MVHTVQSKTNGGSTNSIEIPGLEWLSNIYNMVIASKCECNRLPITECTCFEVLQLNTFRMKGQGIDVGEVKKGYRMASKKFYHPDKKGGIESDFLFVKECYDKLVGPHNNYLGIYEKKISNLEQRKHEEQWGEEKFRTRVE